MSKKIANILYVKVGVVTRTTLINNKREELISGIKKNPISSSYLTKQDLKMNFKGINFHIGAKIKEFFYFCE